MCKAALAINIDFVMNSDLLMSCDISVLIRCFVKYEQSLSITRSITYIYGNVYI